MSKHIRAALGALILAGSLALAAPAGAHNFDSMSWSACYVERTDWTSSSSIQHSHPAEMTPTYVDYHCCAEVGNLSHRWYFATRNTSGATWSHNWSPVYRDDCP